MLETLLIKHSQSLKNGIHDIKAIILKAVMQQATILFLCAAKKKLVLTMSEFVQKIGA